MRRSILALALAVFAPVASAQFQGKLSPKTVAAFEQYQSQVEAKMTPQPRFPNLRAGEVKVEPTSGSITVEVPSGLIHDWTGATIVEHAKAEQVVAVLQNYSAYPKIYGPEVAEARVIRQEGTTKYRVFLKLVKKKVLTAVLHSEYAVDYRHLEDHNAWTITSHSTRMVEVDGANERPEGTGRGFLWRLNAYWLVQQRGDSAYVECRSISLTRNLPTGFGFVVGPFVRDLPMESLTTTLRQTAQAVVRGAN